MAGAAPAYNATKGAIETLTRAWVTRIGPSGVSGNAISRLSPRPGLGRGLPGAVEYVAVYLASSLARFV